MSRSIADNAGVRRRRKLEQTFVEAAHRAPVRVKELGERDRRELLMHFLALDGGDRSLRFGATVSDEVITRYVQKLDFARDSVFGIYDQDFRLVGVGHLAFLPREAIAVLREASEKQQVAELGVSVLPEVRGEGIGTRLFVRAAIHCRNRDVDTLHMKCLARNEAMMHLARKAGMEIHVGCGEANAYLKLRLADPLSVLREAIEEQYAALDYTRQSNFHRPRRRCRALPGEPE